MRLKLLCAALILATACSKSPTTPESPIPTETWSSSPTPSQTASASPSPSPQESTFLLIREGTDLTLQGKYKQALVPLEKAEKITPDDPEVVQQLFLCYAGMEELPSKKSKAYAYAQRVVELVPEIRAAKAREYLEGAETIGLQAPLPKGGKRPADVKGLDKVELGMSEDQVQARVGKMLKPFSGQYSNPGHYVPFYIPQYYFGKKPYAVLFPFDRETGKLTGIYVRPSRYPSGNEAEFLAMEKFVSGMYGPPDRDDDLDNEFQHRKRSVWDFPSCEVHVNLYNGSDFSITYVEKGEQED